jgi:hypothetical protein
MRFPAAGELASICISNISILVFRTLLSSRVCGERGFGGTVSLSALASGAMVVPWTTQDINTAKKMMLKMVPSGSSPYAAG